MAEIVAGLAANDLLADCSYLLTGFVGEDKPPAVSSAALFAVSCGAAMELQLCF